MKQKIDRNRKRIDSAIKSAKKIQKDGADLEAVSHFARYICVLSCAHLEMSIKAICVEYTKNKSCRSVANFVESYVRLFRGPKWESILSLLSRFDKQWSNSVIAATPEEVKDAVISVVSLRNQIAHGESVGVTLSRIERLHSGVVRFVDILGTCIK